MKFKSFISDQEKKILKKQGGSIPVKWMDKIIGKAYLNESDEYIIEIEDNYNIETTHRFPHGLSIGFKEDLNNGGRS